MKNRAFIPLVLGLAVGVVAVKYTMDTVRAARGATDKPQKAKVVVARQDIAATVLITPDMLVVTEAPQATFLSEQALDKPDLAVGRVTMKSIPQGSPILPSMLAPEGTLPGLTVRVKDGYRAVAVKIDESTGVGYLIRPGDWVDVLAVMDVDKRGKRETISRVILQRVQVGAIGQALNGKQQEGGGVGSPAQTATLLVKEDDVPKLHLAQTRGRITLAMRGNDDSRIEEPAEITETEAFGLANAEKEEAAQREPEQAKQSSLASLFAGWRSAAASARRESQPITAPADQPKPFVVSVINGGTQKSGSDTVRHFTYRDANSMELVAVEKGDAPPSRPATDASGAGRAGPEGDSPGLRGGRDEPQANENESGSADQRESSKASEE